MATATDTGDTEHPWRDEELLRELYHEDNLSLYQIADQFGCYPQTVHEWMKKYDIDRRPPSGHSDSEPWMNRDTLHELYHEKELSIREIAEKLGCSSSTVFVWLDKLGISTREGSQEKPVCFFTTKRGYEKWSHKMKDSSGNRRPHQVLVHRLICVSEYGFNSVSSRIVHHKNNIPWDNRPSNLELMTQSDHAKLHHSEDDD